MTARRGDTVDCLIVGAGAAGAAFAWRLASAGIAVTCLEQGDWADYSALPSLGNDWEAARQTTHHPTCTIRQDSSPVCSLNGSMATRAPSQPRSSARSFTRPTRRGLSSAVSKCSACAPMVPSAPLAAATSRACHGAADTTARSSKPLHIRQA